MKRPRIFQRGLASSPRATQDGDRLHLGWPPGSGRWNIADLGEYQVVVVDEAGVFAKILFDTVPELHTEGGLEVGESFLGAFDDAVVDSKILDLPAELVLDLVDCRRATTHWHHVLSETKG